MTRFERGRKTGPWDEIDRSNWSRDARGMEAYPADSGPLAIVYLLIVGIAGLAWFVIQLVRDLVLAADVKRAIRAVNQRTSRRRDAPREARSPFETDLE